MLGCGRLLIQGQIQELKNLHDHCYEVEVKVDARFLPGVWARPAAPCGTGPQPDRGPAAGTVGADLWKLAAASGEQIRCLRPQKSTLEEVFLKALRKKTITPRQPTNDSVGVAVDTATRGRQYNYRPN